MPSLTQDIRPPPATADLPGLDCHDNVDMTVARVGALCSMACARLTAEGAALEARLRAMAEIVPAQALLHEAGTGAARLEAAGNAAVEEIHILAVGLSLRTQESAGHAVDTLREHSEARLAADAVLDAAADASASLQRGAAAATRNIRAAIRRACRRLQAIAGKPETAQIDTHQCNLYPE